MAKEFFSKLGRVQKVLLLMAAVCLALWPLQPFSGFVSGLRTVLLALIFAAGVWLLLRGLAWAGRSVARRFLWRVRHRMIAVYVFVGFIPLTLLITLAGLGIYIVSGPLAAYMVITRIAQNAESLQATAASLGWQLRDTRPEERGAAAQALLEEVRQRFPGAMLRVDTARGVFGIPPAVAEGPLPPRVENQQGVVQKDNELLLAAHAQRAAGSPSILLLVPLTSEFLGALMPALGPVEAAERLPEPSRRRLLAAVPPPAHPFDYALPWPVEIPVLSWETGESEVRAELVLLTRPSAVARTLFSAQPRSSAGVVRVLTYILTALFGVAVLISLVVAVSLTRTLTRTVHELHLGTQRINAGDFRSRIPIRGQDQLGALAESFNRMAASIEELIEESKERQRLQSELEIAREVQTQLFPRAVPELQGLEVFGFCRPAESVSGDFYDYVSVASHRLAVALGDVSGKGISAALVMATVHSLIRAQLSLLAHDDPGNSGATAEVVSRVNQQLYASTSANKFATLVFGTYNDESRVLTYANAGHLPPLLIRGGEVTRLEVHGVVVGAIADAAYTSSAIELQEDDLLVAYTDGVTEPENAYGDEFGESRLIDVLIRETGRPLPEIVNAVIREVDQWSDGSMQRDDMTILALRRQ